MFYHDNLGICLKQRIIKYLIAIIITFPSDAGSALEQTYEACYGITHDDFLSLQCGTNEILYVYDVYTYAKQLSTSSTYGCVHIRQSATYNSTECCHYVNDTEDCGMRYYGSYFVHYCVGINTCTNQVAWNSTLNVCDQTVYFSETHYMKAFYNCIPSSNILDICSSDSTQGNPVYIWNTNYPGKQGDCSSNSGCSCRASSSSSGMKVNVLDLRLYNYLTGDCQQQLHITDGSTEFVISCTAYHAFKRTTVYTSTTSQIQLRFDNVFQYGYGNLWIEIESTSGSVSLSCAPVTAVYGCGDILDPITTSVTTEASTTTPEATASTTLTTATETTINTETASSETTNTETTNGESTTTAITETTATTNGESTTTATTETTATTNGESTTTATTETTNTETTNGELTTTETTNIAPTTANQVTTNLESTVTNTDSTNTVPNVSETTNTHKTTTRTESQQNTSTNDLSQLALIGIICGCVVLAVFLWRTILQAVFMTVRRCRNYNLKKGVRQDTSTKNTRTPKSNKRIKTKSIHVSERQNAHTNIQTKKKTTMTSRSTVDPERIPSRGRNVKVHDITGKSLDVQVVDVIGNNVKIRDDQHNGRERWMNLTRIN